VQVDLGDFTTALDYFEASREICAELGQRPAEARVIGHQATALLRLGCYEEAETNARAALRLATTCGSLQARSGVELALAMVLAAQGDVDDATWLLDGVCDAARRLGQPGLEARASLQLAELHAGEEALGHAQRAGELAAASGVVHVEILALNRAAEISLEAGDLKTADRDSAEAIRRLDAHGNIQGPEEAILLTRARTLEALGQAGGAGQMLERARGVVRMKANLIEDEERRKDYLHGVPLNREILLTEAGQ
jgi:tetratricopeptide (TPR) repeat protein